MNQNNVTILKLINQIDNPADIQKSINLPAGAQAFSHSSSSENLFALPTHPP